MTVCPNVVCVGAAALLAACAAQKPSLSGAAAGDASGKGANDAAPDASSANSAAPDGAAEPAPVARQTESGAYTRYELLAPGSAQFKIFYDVTATTAGAESYFNPIRPGSVATDESVLDRKTGKPLRFAVVDGAAARRGGVPGAKDGDRFIQVHLARPVPAGGEARLRIIKTYRDAQSYFVRDGLLVFARALGIRRNALLLPAGYELVECNYPSQVLTEPSGRVLVSFMSVGEGAVPFTVKARKGRASGRPNPLIQERALQSRDIVYALRQPETHSFDLHHDYTEAKPGVDKYINVVRPGSTVSRPSARNLDTGVALPVETLRGAAITAHGLDIGAPVTQDTEVVVARFPPVGPGESVRLRISETYTDATSYRLAGDQLVFDRSFGRAADAVLLPPGWALSGSAIPATVSLDGDRVRLDFVNPRNDEIRVLLTAARR